MQVQFWFLFVIRPNYLTTSILQLKYCNVIILLMEDNNNKKKDSKVNKLLVGMLIGSAVGSIVGLTMAPKSGRELRGEIAKHSKGTWDKIQEITEKKCHKKEGFWHSLNRFFFGGKK